MMGVISYLFVSFLLRNFEESVPVGKQRDHIWYAEVNWRKDESLSRTKPLRADNLQLQEARNNKSTARKAFKMKENGRWSLGKS